MALVLADRVKETTTSTGTTAITLAGAATGYQTFSSAVGNANTTYYTIADQTGANWEVGIGTYTTSGNTLSRDTVLASSNAGSLVTFTAGTKDVFVTYPAERALYTGGPLGTPTSGTLTNCTFPTLNQNTTGTAATATNLASGSAGTIPYQSASGTTAMLAAGTSGQVLTSAGAAAPTWATASGGGGTKTISNKTAAYTIVSGDLGKIINCTSGTFTVSLTAAATLGAGFTCTIWNTGTGAITIDPAGAETIDGYTTWILRSREGLAVVCGGTNWLTDDKKPMIGYAENNITDARPIASGGASISIGAASTASGNYSLALGALTTASGANAVAIGNTTTTAGANYSTAIGLNSTPTGSVTATGAGAMALGGSYASGVDSFAAAVANNTSSYGATGANSVAIGQQAKATSALNIAIGRNAIASGNTSVCITAYGGTASGTYSAVLGAINGNVLGDYGLVVGGNSCTSYGGALFAANGCTANLGIIIGGNGHTTSQYGKTIVGCSKGWESNSYYGIIVLTGQTTTNTAVPLLTDSTSLATNNQLILSSGQAVVIQGTLIGKQAGSGNMVAYTISGAASNNGGTMASTGLSMTIIGTDSIGLGAAPTITLDTTRKGITITSGYKTSTSIAWTATLNTSEVTLA